MLNLSSRQDSNSFYLQQGCFTHLKQSVSVKTVYFFNTDTSTHKHIISKKKGV